MVHHLELKVVERWWIFCVEYLLLRGGGVPIKNRCTWGETALQVVQYHLMPRSLPAGGAVSGAAIDEDVRAPS